MRSEQFLMSNKLYDYLNNYTDIDSKTFGNAYKSALKAGYSDSYSRVITVRYKRFRLREFKDNADKMKSFLEAMKQKSSSIKEFGNKELLNYKTKRQAKKWSRSVIKRIDELFA